MRFTDADCVPAENRQCAVLVLNDASESSLQFAHSQKRCRADRTHPSANQIHVLLCSRYASPNQGAKVKKVRFEDRANNTHK